MRRTARAACVWSIKGKQMVRTTLPLPFPKPLLRNLCSDWPRRTNRRPRRSQWEATVELWPRPSLRLVHVFRHESRCLCRRLLTPRCRVQGRREHRSPQWFIYFSASTFSFSAPRCSGEWGTRWGRQGRMEKCGRGALKHVGDFFPPVPCGACVQMSDATL